MAGKLRRLICFLLDNIIGMHSTSIDIECGDWMNRISMAFQASAIIDRDWYNALQEFSGYDNVIEYCIFSEKDERTYYDSNQISLSLDEIMQIRKTFRELSAITGASFAEVSNHVDAQIHVYSVSHYDENDGGSDVIGLTSWSSDWFDVTWRNDGSAKMTDGETSTLIHEIGHAVGLDHPNNNGYEEGWDNLISVMSYFDGGYSPTVYRALDIDALQSLYVTEPVESRVPAFYSGDNGTDNLKGTLRPDEIIGWNGNDTLVGVRGSDTILGGRGNDVVRGGNGRDVLTGGEGSDTIYGGFGLNTFRDAKDGSVDKIYLKSDQFAFNYIYGKAGNNSSGEKADKLENLDKIDEIYVQGADTDQLSFSTVSHANGLGSLDGIGIYVSGFRLCMSEVN